MKKIIPFKKTTFTGITIPLNGMMHQLENFTKLRPWSVEEINQLNENISIAKEGRRTLNVRLFADGVFFETFSAKEFEIYLINHLSDKRGFRNWAKQRDAQARRKKWMVACEEGVENQRDYF